MVVAWERYRIPAVSCAYTATDQGPAHPVPLVLCSLSARLPAGPAFPATGAGREKWQRQPQDSSSVMLRHQSCFGGPSTVSCCVLADIWQWAQLPHAPTAGVSHYKWHLVLGQSHRVPARHPPAGALGFVWEGSSLGTYGVGRSSAAGLLGILQVPCGSVAADQFAIAYSEIIT